MIKSDDLQIPYTSKLEVIWDQTTSDFLPNTTIELWREIPQDRQDREDRLDGLDSQDRQENMIDIQTWIVVDLAKVCNALVGCDFGNDWHILEIVVGTIWDPFYMCQFHLHTTPRMLLYISFKTNLNSVPFCFVYLAISFGHNFYISSSKALTSLKLSSSFWLFRISGCIICTQLLYWFFKSEKSFKTKLFFLALSDIWQNHLHTTSILVLQKR